MVKEEIKSSNNNFGVASFILGILSIVLFFTIIPGIILGILGIVFGFIQRKKSKNNWAIWGIILSILGLVLAFLLIWLIFSWINGLKELIENCQINPTLPGCEELAKLIQPGQTTNGYS